MPKIETTTEEHHSDGRTKVGKKILEAGQKVDKLSHKAADKSDELVHKGEEFASKLQKDAGEYGDTVVQYIKENPMKAALIAGGVGLIIGRILKG